jgi:hypothetical protein
VNRRTGWRLIVHAIVFLPIRLSAQLFEALLRVFLCGRARVLILARQFDPALFQNLLKELWRRIVPCQFGAAQMNTFDVFQPLFSQLIGDAFGTQLLVKIFLPPQLHHPLDVAGARAECDAIEQVRNLLLFGQFFRGVTLRRTLGSLLFLTLRLLGRPNRRAESQKERQKGGNEPHRSVCFFIH